MEFRLSTIAAPVRWIRTLYGVLRNGGSYLQLGRYRENIRYLVCDLQGKLALMIVNTSERHKQLRMLCDQYKQAKTNSSPDQDIQAARAKVQEAINAVDSFSKHTLYSATNSVFKSLAKHFHDRAKEGSHKPRFCIKVHKNGKIVTLCRSNGQTSPDDVTNLSIDHTTVDDSFETLVNKNTGFSEVSDTGETYFCNDLCAAAIAGNYINPRLDGRKANRYKASKWKNFKRTISAHPIADDDWIDCWKPGTNGAPTAAECYKSTMIVPINLKHSQIDPEFVEIFQLKHIDIPGENLKYQLGYLCIDCHEVDFFNAEDEYFLFACADILSLFMIISRNFREASGTYALARGIVSEQHGRSKQAGKQIPSRKKG